jgi:hypothetical protein
MNQLGERLATLRARGLRSATSAAVRLVSAQLRGPLRSARLQIRPLRVGPDALARALGGRDPAAALRERALEALPTLAAWEIELDRLDATARAALLGRAEELIEHRFELLGSGPVRLGPTISWQQDFKSGRFWPGVHISRVPIVLGGGSDIKVPWELSRCQHLPLLAAARRVSGEDRFLEELASQLLSFIAANPVEFGANWACTMDVAIRAANWTAALCMAAPYVDGHEPLEPALASLLLHCRFIRAHLEWGEVRGNHYLADVVGLLVACAPFAAGTEGHAWAAWATAQLEQEMRHQVRGDGCDHEASIPYHRLVAELFICGTQAADALCPGSLSDDYRARLQRMLDFVADYTRPDGLAPQIGDADDGRFLPLGSYGADPRDHGHLFAQAGEDRRVGAGHAAYPQGGWYVMRDRDLWSIVRCGDVGLGGIGAHAHNDQLSFELTLGRQPLIVDPGSYLYTADAKARNEFRSTRAHSTLSIDGADQNRLRSDYLFTLPDETQARLLRFETHGPCAIFVGEHSGFRELSRELHHRRELRFDGERRIVQILDTVLGGEGRELSWSFPLAPCEVSIDGCSAVAVFPAAKLTIAVVGATLELGCGWISPSYGRRLAAPVLRAKRRADSQELTTRFTLTICSPTVDDADDADGESR